MLTNPPYVIDMAAHTCYIPPPSLLQVCGFAANSGLYVLIQVTLPTLQPQHASISSPRYLRTTVRFPPKYETHFLPIHTTYSIVVNS